MSAIDAFVHPASLLTIPPANAFGITPADGVEIPYVTRALYIGTGGDVAVVTAAGDTAVFKNMADGAYFPIRAIAVLATGTTADDILGLY